MAADRTGSIGTVPGHDRQRGVKMQSAQREGPAMRGLLLFVFGWLGFTA